MFAEVAIPVAVDQLFTYAIPVDLQSAAQPGVRVVVSFGKRTLTGFLIRLNTTTSLRNIKPIVDVLDASPILSSEMLLLAEWIAEYYMAPIGEVLKSMLVQGSATAGKRIVRLAIENPPGLRTQSKQEMIVNLLRTDGETTLAQLQKKLSIANLAGPVAELLRRGVITIEEELPRSRQKPKLEKAIVLDSLSRTRWFEWIQLADSLPPAKNVARQVAAVRNLIDCPDSIVSLTEFLRQSGVSLSTIRTLEKNGLLTTTKREVVRKQEYDFHEASLGAQNITLNADQGRVLGELNRAFDAGSFQTFLLHGVTGSGKTQVYIEAIRDILARGKTAIVLVPEIALTPQIVRRFTHHFGEKVVAIHSRMSAGERYDAWRMARDGRYSIVIGPRSAIFAPLRNIGLIVVDEEHEPSYKQFDQTPRYHARDVAVMRASYNNAVVVLGSATPSFESYTNALTGKYSLLELPERVDTAQMPRIDIIDMTTERRSKLDIFREQRKAMYKTDPEKARTARFEFKAVSDFLREKIADRLTRREGIILLQNRRGFATFIECPDCGYVEMCENCNISLTYHQTKKHMRCHYCGFVKQPPEVCPQCRSTEIVYRGFGTQRIEEELVQLFPSATIARMDLDTTTQRGSHDKLLKSFADGTIDILLGTQMVAKGLDFPRVTLVGVISADTQMLLPDFRSAERTFQLLTQVAGRAGRSTLAGEVVIQTFQSRHYSLQHVLTHDFKGFYAEEKTFRGELHYPPYSRLVLVEFKGKQEPEVMRHAMKFAELLKRLNHEYLTLGPASAAITRLKGFFRWHIVIKGMKSKDPSGHKLHEALRQTLAEYGKTVHGTNRSVRVTIDVDPQGMM